MKTPKHVLEQMRLCEHSEIRCDGRDLQPDYYCRMDRKLCVPYGSDCSCRKAFDTEKEG